MNIHGADFHFQGFKRANDQNPVALEFCQWFYVHGDEHTLSLLGDTFDLYPHTYVKTLQVYEETFSRLSTQDIQFIPGNHDYGITYLNHMFTWEIFKPGEFIDSQGRRWWREHGHEQDPIWGDGGVFDVSSPKGLKAAQAFLSTAVALETLFPQLDQRAVQAANWMVDKVFPEGKRLGWEHYAKVAMEKFNQGYFGYICGHTHDVWDFVFPQGQRMMNPGAWTEERCYFVDVDTDQVYRFTGPDVITATNEFRRTLTFDDTKRLQEAVTV